MRTLTTLIAATILLPVCGGCLSTPNLAHPGTVEYQQARARVFKTYPEDEPGPPIVGARPREYQDPTAYVNRAKPAPGEVIVSPYPQAAPQAPLAQPSILTAPPAFYCPPAAQPITP